MNLKKGLHNTYFALRHGKSLANEQDLIVSHIDDALSGFGLNAEGKEQVKKSAEKAKQHAVLDSAAIIISSDFSRTVETAQIAADVLGVKDIRLEPKLRERFFGDWDKTHNSNYQNVWDTDSSDHTHKERGVESVAEVLDRATNLIGELENKYSGKSIILVSHGDTLQILQTAFDEIHPSKHRSLAPLQTAEIRRLN